MTKGQMGWMLCKFCKETILFTFLKIMEESRWEST